MNKINSDMLKCKPPVIFFSLLLSLTGCAVYHPQTTDIPLIDHKGDIRIDMGASVIPSVHSTVSYGLTKKIAVQAFGSIGPEDRHYLQLSPGFYKCLDNKKVIELYSGIGFGNANTVKNPLANLPEAIHQSLHGKYQLYFVQFNWGKNTNESRDLDWGIGLKTGLFHSELTDMNYYSTYSETEPFPVNKENSILLEPVFSFRIGKENTKFTYKFAITRILKLNHPENYIPAPVINMSLGVNFRFKQE
jgi:hypothetical protein